MKRGRRKKDIAPVFKRYEQDQPLLLPPSVDELIPLNHMVRAVDKIIRQMDITPLVKEYKGGGTSSYHPEMLIKVMVFSYINKTYSSRQIAKALRENIAFMWLSAGNRPDFRTINNFRSGRLKGAIDELFGKLLKIMVNSGYVKYENYFVDGTKIEADANRHNVVWAKNTQRYKKIAENHIRNLLHQIDEINDKENREYGDRDLEELGEEAEISSADIEKVVQAINESLKDKDNKDKTDKDVERLGRKIDKEYLPKLKKYEEQEHIAAGRKSYSVTDTDASVMMMKDERLLPGYNVQIGTEKQFIINYSTHNNAGDSGLFQAHMNKFYDLTGVVPDSVIGDSAYGSEENYEFCESNQVAAYLKYNIFHKEKSKKYSDDISRKENMIYHASCDEYECANGRRLKFKEEKNKKSNNGFPYTIRRYECESCADCSLSQICKKAKGNRGIEVNRRLNYLRWKAKRLLDSEKGIVLRKRRSVEVESVFGDIKQNMGFRRFKLRGILKVNSEVGLISMAHNLKKMFKAQKGAAQNLSFYCI
jgi:transposase